MKNPRPQPTDKPHRVFLIDDHPLMRAGTARVISGEPHLELCGEFDRCRGAVDLLLKTAPDVILLDLSLPDGSGLELIKDARSVGVKAPILVVSMHDEKLYAERVLRAGGDGYIMKDEATERVIDGIRVVLSGDVFLSDDMNRRMLKRLTGRESSSPDGLAIDRLTDREFEVFELIGRGMPSRVVATNLSISTKTVDAHRAHIKEKLGLSDASELVRYAVRWAESGPKSNRGGSAPIP